MNAHVAYGNKNNMMAAIQNGIIPNDCFIITKDELYDAELFFYDIEGKLKQIVTQSKFNDLQEALAYIEVNMTEGKVITILEDGKYSAYVVQPDGTLDPVCEAVQDPDDIPTTLTERVEELEEYSHAHGNKIILDGIEQEDIDFWNDDVSIMRVEQSPEDIIVLNGNHLM